jgi:predicted RNA methylase
MKVSDDILAVLTAALVDGHSLTLTGMLDRKLYERTNKVLEAAGGKWNRKAKAHVFEMPAEDAIEQIVLSGEITIPQDFGYFPTPPAVVERLVELAEVRSHHRVLEPSAGRGNIACAFRDAKTIDCVELLATNVAELEKVAAAHWSITKTDFLTVDPAPRYDRVVMNPPFAKRADIHHVNHALRFLAPGGLLVAVMSAGAKFRSDRLTSDCLTLVDERGGQFEDVPERAFKESGTMVHTVLVTIPA